MKLVSATLYALRIPLRESFKHSLFERLYSDSVVLRVRDDDGIEGFGEGLARSYLTGETPEFVMDFVAAELWPAVAHKEVPPLDRDLTAVGRMIPSRAPSGVIAANASRCVLELAIVDAVLRRERASITAILPPRRENVVYSSTIASATTGGMLERARRLKEAGLRHVKTKVGMDDDDVSRVAAIREILGPEVSIRIDANGAWTPEKALDILRRLEPLRIDAVEQPLPRGPIADYVALRRASPIPVMVDESLVTVEDARQIIAAKAADIFNVRVSKCGGLRSALEIASLASAAGVKVVVGGHPGETAVHAMATRALASTLEELVCVEGSNVLSEDVTAQDIRYGHGGIAPIPSGYGLGVDVLEERLLKYAVEVRRLN